ncbi:MAG: DUF1849 family protein [Alphaproteobacteria bacterium]|nr:DUF1849 family protein [Alphaproteobacteria bacterium]
MFKFILPAVLALSCLGAPAHAAVASFAPHRAIYDMKMASARNGSSVAGVEGKMFFEWADACDAWIIDQKLQLKFYYAEGDVVDRVSSFSTWEAKNGKRYRFATRSLSNGQETTNLRGEAELGKDGGEATYHLPKETSIKLPAGTLFPSAHTFEVLRAADEGNRFFKRTIFDGNDEEGMIETSVFISPKIEDTAAAMADKDLKSNELLKQPSWPVRMAFFRPDGETGEPDYEMDMHLLANGVASSMVIDYGDFVLTGTLSELEPLARPGC